MKADLNPPDDVRWIAETLDAAGHTVWTVGGAVRDALIGLEPEDWDLTTSARPPQIQRLFRRTVPIGIDHGTVGVIGQSGRMYEVTTYRRDVETFGRKARVEFSDRLEDDLDRRDFTINAIAWDPASREVVDPHAGLEDLRERRLRTVGDASERFREDRLRVLRALRFAGRFEMVIDPDTWSAIVASNDKLEHLSAERIRDELWKVLGGHSEASRALRLYVDSGVLATVYPELEQLRQEDADAWETSLGCVDRLPMSRPMVRMAALFLRAKQGGVGEPATNGSLRAAVAGAVMRRLRASNAETDLVVHLVAQAGRLPPPDAADAVFRRWVRLIGREHLADLFLLEAAMAEAAGRGREDVDEVGRRAERVARSGAPMAVGELEVGGTELKRIGVRPGPVYGEILEELLEMVTDDPGIDQQAALEELVRRRG